MEHASQAGAEGLCKWLIFMNFIEMGLSCGGNVPEIWGRKPNRVGDMPHPQAVTACIARILLISLSFYFGVGWHGSR